MPYAIRLPLVLKTVVVHLLLPAALAISLGAAGGVVHADVLPPQMQDASESAAAAEAELTQGFINKRAVIPRRRMCEHP